MRRGGSSNALTLGGVARDPRTIFGHVALGFIALFLGCSRDQPKPDPAKNSASVVPPASSASPPLAANVSSPSGATHASATPSGHDAAHPPIDCPLRKKGVDPHSLRPFEDVSKYIEFLERPDRARWQKPDDVVTALKLSGRETVVDLGAGSGYFTFRFARALETGRVIAIDVESEMVRHIHHKTKTEGISNVQAVLASPDDPPVTSDADLVFVCDVLHHVKDRPDWMAKLFARMGAGARLVLIEFKEGDLPEGPPAKVKIARSKLEALVRNAGFGKLRIDDKLLPYQLILEASKPKGP